MITDNDGNPMTVAESILRSWANSKEVALQKAFIEYCYGKPPEKLEATGIEGGTTLILHFAHERARVEALAANGEAVAD